MITPEEFQQIASKLSLTLDSPESVKQQVKQITFAQKQLRAIKKELSLAVRNINQQATQASADSFLSVLNDIAGNRKLAGEARAIKRRTIEQNKKEARQPYLELQAAIDNLILEGDRLKLLAEEYLLDPVGVKARIQAEEEQRRLAEQEELRLAEELRRRQEEAFNRLLQQLGGFSGLLALLISSVALILVVFGIGLFLQGLPVNWFITGFWLLILIGGVGWFIKNKSS